MDDSIGEDGLIPAFTLSVFDDADGVTLITHNEPPDIKRHASPALLYGLAIMTLDRQGVIEQMVEDWLAQGCISEVDAVNRIAVLLAEDANELPA